MFEYVFPIFAFGVVISGIVCKGLYEAAEEARIDAALKRRATNGASSSAEGSPLAVPSDLAQSGGA